MSSLGMAEEGNERQESGQAANGTTAEGVVSFTTVSESTIMMWPRKQSLFDCAEMSDGMSPVFSALPLFASAVEQVGSNQGSSSMKEFLVLSTLTPSVSPRSQSMASLAPGSRRPRTDRSSYSWLGSGESPTRPNPRRPCPGSKAMKPDTPLRGYFSSAQQAGITGLGQESRASVRHIRRRHRDDDVAAGSIPGSWKSVDDSGPASSEGLSHGYGEAGVIDSFPLMDEETKRVSMRRRSSIKLAELQSLLPKKASVFPHIKRTKAFYAAIRLLQAIVRRNARRVTIAAQMLISWQLFARFRMRHSRQRHATRLAAGYFLSKTARGYVAREAWLRYCWASLASESMMVRTFFTNRHNSLLCSALLLEASSRRYYPRDKYIRRVSKVRRDVERYGRLAEAEKSFVRFNMSYHFGSSFKDIKIKSLQSAAATSAGYLLNSLNTYQRLAVINSVDIGQQQRDYRMSESSQDSSPPIPSSPSRPLNASPSQHSSSPLALRVTTSRGPLALLPVLSETLSQSTPRPRTPLPPTRAADAASSFPLPSDAFAGHLPLVNSMSTVETMSSSRRPAARFARAMYAGSAQVRCKPNHTGLPVIDQHRASMQPDGTFVALDAIYDYDKVALKSADVRWRAALTLADLEQDAMQEAVSQVFEQVALELITAIVEHERDALEKALADALSSVEEEFERLSSEYVSIFFVGARGIPFARTYAACSFASEIASGIQTSVQGPSSTPFWWQGFLVSVPKGGLAREIQVTVSEDGGVLGGVGKVTISLDDLQLQGVEVERWYDMTSDDKLSSSAAAGSVELLVVEVIEADGLTLADRGGTSDPYAVIQFGGRTVQTQVVEKTLSPKWQETFWIPMASPISSMRIDIYDKDVFPSGSGDFLGGADVDVKAMMPIGRAMEMWIELGGQGGEGRVKLKMWCIRETDKESKSLKEVGLRLARFKEVLRPMHERDDVFAAVLRYEGGYGLVQEKGFILSLNQQMRRLRVPTFDPEGPPLVPPDVYVHWDMLLEGSSLDVAVGYETGKESAGHGRIAIASLLKEEEALVWVNLDGGMGRVLVWVVRKEKPKEKMEIVITVKCARGLLAADKGDTSDPFAQVQVGDSVKKRTKVVPKTLNPTWEETMIFDLEGGFIVVDVFDHNLLGGADFLGCAQIDPKTLMMDRPMLEWFPLGICKTGDKVQGSIRLSLLKQSRRIPEEYYVEVLEARKLVAADRSRSSDPFVILNLENNKVKTQVIKATLNPQWNQAFSFLIDEDSGKAVFEVYNYNTFGRNTFIGSCEANLKNLLLGGKPLYKWLKLDPEKPSTCTPGGSRPTPGYKTNQSTAYGELHVRVRRQRVSEYRQQDGDVDKCQHRDCQRERATLTVTVVEARGLIAADRGGTSDPFVMISFPTLRKPLRTAVVSKSLDPVWNEVWRFNPVLHWCYLLLVHSSSQLNALQNLEQQEPFLPRVAVRMTSPPWDLIFQTPLYLVKVHNINASSGSRVEGSFESQIGQDSGKAVDSSGVRNVLADPRELSFEVFDYDLIGSNNFLGRCVIPVSMLRPGKVFEQWMNLEPGKKNKNQVTGSLRLKVLLQPAGEPDS